MSNKENKLITKKIIATFKKEFSKNIKYPSVLSLLLPFKGWMLPSPLWYEGTALYRRRVRLIAASDVIKDCVIYRFSIITTRLKQWDITIIDSAHDADNTILYASVKSAARRLSKKVALLQRAKQ